MKLGFDELKKHVREIPNFPKEGILFYDITTVLNHPVAFSRTVEIFRRRYEHKIIDRIVGIEARGFIFGAALAYALGLPFVPVRKKGKLPGETSSVKYSLEYGEDEVEIHKGAVVKGERIILVDDLLATGGTLAAAAELLEAEGAVVEECAVVIELTFLNGREKLGSRPLVSLIEYDSEEIK